MQRDVDRVRHAIHDRAGPASLEAAARALPTHVDTKFCGDAVTAVHMLIFAVPSLAEPFFRSLHSDEKRHVDFIKNVRLMQRDKNMNRVLERANASWTEFSRKAAYGICHRKVSEKRNLAARELWKDYIDGLQLDVGVRSWSKPGQDKRAKFPTSKPHISAVFHSFRLIFGRAIISRNALEAWMLFPERARAEHSR